MRPWPSAPCASAISDSVPPSPLLSARSRIRHVFAGDDEDQRPQDQRQHAEHAFVRDDIGWSRRRLERDAKGIKRARADVAEHDAHAAERERPEACAARAPPFQRHWRQKILNGPAASKGEGVKWYRGNAEIADAIHQAVAT